MSLLILTLPSFLLPLCDLMSMAVSAPQGLHSILTQSLMGRVAASLMSVGSQGDKQGALLQGNDCYDHVANNTG